MPVVIGHSTKRGVDAMFMVAQIATVADQYAVFVFGFAALFALLTLPSLRRLGTHLRGGRAHRGDVITGDSR